MNKFLKIIVIKTYTLASYIISSISRKLTKIVNNRIVIICNCGNGYCCNPKYIVEAMEELYPGKFEFILLTNKVNLNIPKYIKQIRYRRLLSIYYLSTAKFWIDNFRTPKYMGKLKKQFYVQTWHGGLGIKKVEKDAEQVLPVEYIKTAIEDGKITDLMFANNELTKQIYKKSFWYSGSVIRCGMPRNHYLVHCDDRRKFKIKQKIGINKDIKLVLYAPTFRKDLNIDIYNINFQKITEYLNVRFDGIFKCMYRLHPALGKISKTALFSGAINVTNYPDVQELLEITDVLITDYSSIAEDFALTKKPIFIYAPDIDDYMNDRGFYYSVYERPFPLAENIEGLLLNIEKFNYDEYNKNVNFFFKRFNLIDDGYGDRCIAKKINSIYEENNI